MENIQGVERIIVLISVLFCALIFPAAPSSAQSSNYGPRTDLVINYYANDAALWAALTTGAIDLSASPLTPAQYSVAITSPTILLAPVRRLDVTAWSLNNNWTIAQYPGINSPMSHVEFRKAIWRLSDKNYYTQLICGGFATPLPVPIAAPSSSWWNQSVVNYVNTQLSFSVSGAAALLDAGGFTQGTTPNPYYHPAVPGSAQYMRVYPPTTQSTQAWIIATSPLPNQPNLPIGQASYALPLKYAVVGDPTDKANLEVWFDATTSYASLDPATDYTYNAGTKTITVTKVFNDPIGPLATVNKRFHVIYKHAHQKAGQDLGEIWLSHDVRLTAVGLYAPWSSVWPLDIDVGESLVVFNSASSPYEKHRENIAVNGLYDPGEYIYRDIDNNGAVSVNDMRLTTVGPYPAGSIVAGSEPIYQDVDNDAFVSAGDVRLTPVGEYAAGSTVAREYIYKDIDNSGTVSVNDVRITPVGEYAAGSTVNPGDLDIGQTLVLFRSLVSPYEKHRENIAVNGLYDNGEFIYRDGDNSGAVSSGDLRLTRVGAYASGSSVSIVDADVGQSLVVFNSASSPYEKHRENMVANDQYDPEDTDIGGAVVAFISAASPYEKHLENVNANGNYDLGEYIYRDVDNDALVSASDVRLTRVGSYPAGSTVASGDLDIGQTLVLFRSLVSPYEKHRENIAVNGLYDPEDSDVDSPFVVFQSLVSPYEKHRENIAVNGLYDPGEYIYRDIDNNGAVSVKYMGGTGIRFFARNDDVLRYGASVHLRDMMLKSGIPVDWNPAGFSTCYSNVMSARNYHIYSASSSVGRFPTYLYSWFHSNRWFAGGSNYHTGEVLSTMSGFTTQVSPVAHYKDVDYSTYQIQYPPDYEWAGTAAKNAQYFLVEKHAVMVPLWSTVAFYAYSDLLGVVNMDCVGPENDYTYLNAMKPSNPSLPLTIGLAAPPLEVNQIYSRWPSDVSTMNPVMSSFTNTPAYDILTDQPNLAQDWELGIWTDPDDGKLKSKMTFWFRDDAEWTQPITGNILADFDTQWLTGAGTGRSGYAFNCWYYDSEPAGWIYTSYRDIKRIRTYPAERKAEVYFDSYSYWNQHNADGRILYSSSDPAFPGWKQAPLVQDGDPLTPGTQPTTATFAGPIAANDYLPLPIRALGTPVEVVEIKEGGTTLTPITDYEIVGSIAYGPRIRMYKAIALGSSITVKYYGRGDPAGYSPGGLGWASTLVGTGCYYMTAHTSGAGGSSTYSANSDFFLETPPWGEIDFKWYGIYGTKPRDGYFTVDIYDAVLGTGAFESQGYAVPGAYWRPGADLAPSPSFPTPPFPAPTPPANSPGAIDGYDIGVITADYGTTWGSPAPNPPP